MMKSVSRVSLLVVLAAAAVVAAGCSSDQPRRNDDAGQVAAPANDAGNADNDSARAPADAGQVPVVETQVDAGHIADANKGSDKVDPLLGPTGDAPAITPPKPIKADPLQVTIFNRLLVKPKSKMTGEQVQDLAEKATGEKIELVRRTAGTFWLLQFTPAKTTRTIKDQKALMAALEKSGQFEFVEADQIMTIK